jgi:hypothetical protein
MRRPSGLTRALRLLTLVLQLMLPTVVSAADARIERDVVSARAFSHVESHTTKNCPQVHRADCVLCQHLTTPMAKASKPAPPTTLLRCESPAVAQSCVCDRLGAEAPSLPRAPPKL